MLALQEAAWFGVMWVLRLGAPNSSWLASGRMNAVSAFIVAVFVGCTLWRRFVQTELLQQALAESNARLLRLAVQDPLTGLLNRREFMRQAEMEQARAARLGVAMSIADDRPGPLQGRQ
ncbi:MAG: GGDEF domain-containing protein [Comamonadaceae bacterium]|nr:GGDEF domain-containing protein [Burkholderiales bacterium]MEB2348105.1 GGDEF domain-containing protein [Comamonadaceae bacterium]